LKETTFIPAAYSISEITVGMVLLMLLFVKMDPYYACLLIYGIIAFLFTGLLMLIKQIDNPFAVRKNTYATVDPSLLFKLEERMFAKVE
jgi:predicted membrane chloride channel (bestrophin family)